MRQVLDHSGRGRRRGSTGDDDGRKEPATEGWRSRQIGPQPASLPAQVQL